MMNNKGRIGWLLTIILAIVLLLIIFFGFYFGLTNYFEGKKEIVSARALEYKTQQQMLSLFTPSIVKDLLDDKTLKFKEAMKKVYDENAQCKLMIGEEEKDIGCQKVKSFSEKIELKFPRYYGEDVIIKFEVVTK